MKYIIQYTYDCYDLGCGCCTESTSEIHIYEEHHVDVGIYTSHIEHADLIEDDNELREYINNTCPEFNNFDVHPDTRYF